MRLFNVVCLFLALLSYEIAAEKVDKTSEGDDAKENPEPVDHHHNDEVDDEEQTVEVTEEYAKGSLCHYCDYCKFCKLCDEDCPCETSPTKPNCKMCKYCKYCYLCSALCDTICKPGGFVDRASAAIVNSLPSFNKEEVDDDIDSVKHWIERKKDEL